MKTIQQSLLSNFCIFMAGAITTVQLNRIEKYYNEGFHGSVLLFILTFLIIFILLYGAWNLQSSSPQKMS